MYAVGRLGSYITQGVYTVSGPFHPFGGAVDIIVVEQPDGSFKSSPWYVRFGKFQGVLKAREQVVTITVNGIETNIHMYLDPRGEAYFLREIEGEEGESVSYCSSSSDDMDEQSQKNRRPMKSKSCNYDGSNSNSGDQINASNGSILARSNSRQSRISGLVLGQRLIKEDDYQEGGDGAGVVRISSLEQAEIAANLVEKFMLNESDLGENLVVISEISRKIDEPSLQYADEDIDVKDVISEVTCSDSDIVDTFEASPNKKLDEKQASDEKDISPGFRVSEEEVVETSEISRKIVEPCLQNADQDNDAEDAIPEFTCSNSEIVDMFEAFPGKKLDKKQSSVERDVELPGFPISEEESESGTVQSFIHSEISGSSTGVLEGSKEEPEIADVFEACPREKLGEKLAPDERDVVLPGFGVSEKESGSSSLQSFIHFETSNSSTVVLDGSKEQSEIADAFEACPGVSVEESGLSSIQSSMHCETSESSVVPLDASKEQSDIAGGFEACPDEKSGEKQASDERDVVLTGFGVSREEGGFSSIQSSMHCETSESSVVVLDGSKEQSEIAGVFEACLDEKLGEKQASNERDVVLPGFGVSVKESGSSSVQSSVHYETSKSSIAGLDGSKEQSEIAGVFEACLDEKLGEKLASNERDVVLQGFGGSVEESGSSSVQSSIHCEISESSTVGLDGSKEQSEIDGVFEVCSGKKEKKKGLDERDVESPGFGVSEEESGSSGVQSFIHCGTSESCSVMGLDGLKRESGETLSLPSGGRREVHFCAETLHVTTESLAEDTVKWKAEDIELEREDVESCGGHSQQMDPSSTSMCGHDETNFESSLTMSTSFAQTAYDDPVLGSVEVESKTISFNTSFGNSVNIMQEEIDIGYKIIGNDLQLSLDSVGDLEQLNGDYAAAKAALIPVSESSEEEQFFFSDIDDFELKETQGESNFPGTVDEEANFPYVADEENHPSISLEGQLNGSLNANDESYSSPDNFVQKNRSGDFENFTENLKLTSSPIDISKRHSVASAEDGRLTESLPDLWSHMGSMGTEDLHHPLSHSLDLNSESLEWELPDKNESQYAKSDTGNENQSTQEYSNKEDNYQLEDIKNGVGNPAVGDPSKAVVTTGGSWSLWPFPFRRSRSRKTVQPTVNDTRISDGENVSDSNICTDDNKRVLQRRASKKMVKAMTPTSKELASLNLKEGSNTVMFTFSTAMLGRQKVDARIYLWKWNTRIVISDVDGTITKSDVLGQFMPLVGVDWSQTGVAHLFSAIKDNGYQFLYLSARAIAQAYITRQFLVNLKQDGKALPDGPVVISPDGLFPSLFREVIRRAPHEFKIACLEDIRALFPSDCNPFYAGFGNRDTDEISYLKVGIPRGKIFIINPKGEVAVNRLVDTRSYTSLHALVHGMFPVMTSSEQEDFNSWNFWKLPPPDIDH